MTPAGVIWGYQVIHEFGTKGKHASCGTETQHFFVDTKNRLYQLREELTLLDYREYLSVLSSSVVMSYDTQDDLIYICDGTYGFIYSVRDHSLGTGPVNITGIGNRLDTKYVIASSAIVTPAFDICTDIYDLGTHKYKTVFELEVGTNVTGTLQASIYYRDSIKAAFSQTAWKDVALKGNVFLTALGREFKYRFRTSAYEDLHIDYVIARGIIHEH